MKNLIDLYIKDYILAWAPTTLKSERYRLYGVVEHLTGDASHLWAYLENNYKPYGRTTIWTRVVGFWQWTLDNNYNTGENVYATFRRKNARLFKNTYQTKKPALTFKEAAALIKALPNSGDRALAMQILGSGERYSESIQRIGNEVVGKGSKRRTTYRPGTTESNRSSSYASFRRALKAIGLKPHDLRKLCATRLVEGGMNEADLMEVMGWSSIVTAKSYLQPKKEEQLKKMFSQIHKELK